MAAREIRGDFWRVWLDLLDSHGAAGRFLVRIVAMSGACLDSLEFLAAARGGFAGLWGAPGLEDSPDFGRWRGFEKSANLAANPAAKCPTMWANPSCGCGRAAVRAAAWGENCWNFGVAWRAEGVWFVWFFGAAGFALVAGAAAEIGGESRVALAAGFAAFLRAVRGERFAAFEAWIVVGFAAAAWGARFARFARCVWVAKFASFAEVAGFAPLFCGGFWVFLRLFFRVLFSRLCCPPPPC